MEIATTDLWERVDALDDGRGFVDRSNDRTLVVRGADARGWLGDLVTADVASLEPGSSRRSLLLTATGRIRADLWITRIDRDAFVVLQAIDQPEPVEDVLRPYVLSSAVALEDATGRRSTHAFPGRGEIVTVPREDPVRRSGPRLAAKRCSWTNRPTRSGGSDEATRAWAPTSRRAPCPRRRAPKD